MNNKIFVSGRKTGKTTYAIVESLETGRHILVANKKMAEVIYKKSKEMGLTIPYPITMQEWFNRGVAPSVKSSGVIIDEGLIFLEQLLGTKIHLITMSEDKGTTKITNNKYEVVIPDFVSKYIEIERELGNDKTVDIVIQKIKQRGTGSRLYNWLMKDGNRDVFARAWLNGFTVSLEKFYHIHLPGFGYVTGDPDYPFSITKNRAKRFTLDDITKMDNGYLHFKEEE